MTFAKWTFTLGGIWGLLIVGPMLFLESWIAANDRWDMLIVDLFLKGGSGMRLVQRVRRSRPEQKIIVFSNYVNASVRKRCAQLGVDAVFDKSTEIDALVDYCSHQCTQLGAQSTLAPEHPSGGPA